MLVALPGPGMEAGSRVAVHAGCQRERSRKAPGERTGRPGLGTGLGRRGETMAQLTMPTHHGQGRDLEGNRPGRAGELRVLPGLRFPGHPEPWWGTQPGKLEQSCLHLAQHKGVHHKLCSRNGSHLAIICTSFLRRQVTAEHGCLGRWLRTRWEGWQVGLGSPPKQSPAPPATPSG